MIVACESDDFNRSACSQSTTKCKRMKRMDREGKQRFLFGFQHSNENILLGAVGVDIPVKLLQEFSPKYRVTSFDYTRSTRSEYFEILVGCSCLFIHD